jgi:hypothetical protein
VARRRRRRVLGLSKLPAATINFANLGKNFAMAFNPNRSQEYRIEVLLDRLWETGVTGQQGIDKMKVHDCFSNPSLIGSLVFGLNEAMLFYKTTVGRICCKIKENTLSAQNLRHLSGLTLFFFGFLLASKEA